MIPAPFFAALFDPQRPCPPGLRAWNGADPAARFAVYRNNVTVSLVDALAGNFPVTLELVGDAFFRAMAAEFVRACPPRTRVLAHYGGEFPGFVEGFPPARAVPYLADVARLEWLRVRAYHAADTEEEATASVAAALADTDTLPGLRASFHPAAGLLRSRYAALSLWAAHHGEGDLSQVDASVPEDALVIRPALEVEVVRVQAPDAAFLSALLDGRTLGQAAGDTAAAHPDFDLAAAARLLVRRGVLVSLTRPRNAT